MRLSCIQQFLRSLTACVLATTMVVPPAALAQAHIVSPEEMQKEIVAASQAREKDRQAIVSFLSTHTAGKALKTAQLDINRVKTAVSSLSDDELNQLASRVGKAKLDFAAGRISDRDLLWILVGIAALILIIVAVR